MFPLFSWRSFHVTPSGPEPGDSSMICTPRRRLAELDEIQCWMNPEKASNELSRTAASMYWCLSRKSCRLPTAWTSAIAAGLGLRGGYLLSTALRCAAIPLVYSIDVCSQMEAAEAPSWAALDCASDAWIASSSRTSSTTERHRSPTFLYAITSADDTDAIDVPLPAAASLFLFFSLLAPSRSMIWASMAAKMA